MMNRSSLKSVMSVVSYLHYFSFPSRAHECALRLFDNQQLRQQRGSKK